MNPKTYLCVELTPVTSESLTEVLNAHAADGWTLNRVDYVKENGVRRPVMAFVFFECNSPNSSE